MSKAILVIDMPKNCNECRIRFDDEYSNWCSYDNPEPNGVWQYVDNGTKPDWCPLKPAPEKDEVCYLREWSNGYKKGWNDCVNYLVGD